MNSHVSFIPIQHLLHSEGTHNEMYIYDKEVQNLLEPAGGPHTRRTRGSPSHHSNIKLGNWGPLNKKVAP